MKRTMLNGLWELSFTSPIDQKKYVTQAPVPGNVEPILKELGLIDDYLPADDEFATEEWSLVDDWCYTTQFSYAPSDNGAQELVFEGIDTIADIYLNGAYALRTENMHRSYRLPLDTLARVGENTLTVQIRSGELYARERAHDNYAVPHGMTTYFDSQVYLRKARHHWGWDNAPRLLTCGIWRSVYVEELPRERFENVYLHTVAVNDEFVQIGASWHYATPARSLSSLRVKFSLFDGENRVAHECTDIHFTQGRSIITLPRENARLWWPANMGEAFLYTVRLEMYDGDRLAASYSAPFGIRTVTLDMSEDVDGTDGRFQFYVNNEPVFILGTNWKPLDPLPSIADRKTATLRALKCAKDLHCNMIRIWGGGFYEGECFFDFCDKEGILVWQDFMFACETPPTDEDFLKEVSCEATEIVKRYRNHTSLAVWCGDNENDLRLTWIAAPSATNPSDSAVTRKVLRDAVLHYDPYRPYIPSSPYISDRAYRAIWRGDDRYVSVESHLYPNAVNYGTALRSLRSIFIGETGPIGVNPISSDEESFAREAARAERLWNAPRISGPASHQSDSYFIAWRQSGRELCLARYGRDFAFSEWNDYAIAVNLACSEIYKDAIEYCRVTQNKTGVIWWSLTDMWKMLFNYSVSDSNQTPKLPYHLIKRSQEALCLMAVRNAADAPLTLYVDNATLHREFFSYTVTACTKDAKEVLITQGSCTAEKNATRALCTLPTADEAQLLVIEWSVNGKTHTNHAFPAFGDFEAMRSLLKIYAQKIGLQSIL